jgi:hypothetical protein
MQQRKPVFHLGFGLVVLGLMVSCQPKGTPENRAKLAELEVVLDSVNTILEPLPDVVVFEELSRKMTAQYRFFYDNFADLEHSDTLLEWLSGLEASRKFVTRFANDGDGLKSSLEEAKKQVATLKHDYSNGLFTDSLFEVYYLQEAAAVEDLMKKTQKKAAPLDYYLGVMNQIKSPLDSAMFYYQNKLNL